MRELTIIRIDGFTLFEDILAVNRRCNFASDVDEKKKIAEKLVFSSGIILIYPECE